MRGVNPEACRDAVIEAARRRGFGGKIKIGIVAGDDIMSRLDEFISRGVELNNQGDGRTAVIGSIARSKR
jgi:hypothetical protein